MYIPVLLGIGRFKFIVYVGDHAPPHVHIKASGAEARIYLDNAPCYFSRGFDQKTINWLVKIVRENSELLLEGWNEIFKEEN